MGLNAFFAFSVVLVIFGLVITVIMRVRKIKGAIFYEMIILL